MAFEIKHGDCLEVMRGMADNSVDAIVTDPPYGLVGASRGGSSQPGDLATPYGRSGPSKKRGGFMGKEWDASIPGAEYWSEALRIAKPGAYILAFGGTRTFHRLAVAIEDAGWEIRDTLMWVYGSGFPKSRNVCLDMDKMDGHGNRGHRIAVANRHHPDGTLEPNGEHLPAYEPKTDAAKQWAGWGTALKPAWEPIIMARKPMVGTVAANVLEHGTGALNIDACRVETTEVGERREKDPERMKHPDWRMTGGSTGSGASSELGRWPANLIHDGSEEVLAGFPQSKGTASGGSPDRNSKSSEAYWGEGGGGFKGGRSTVAHGDNGSAARFFYCAKASKSDRGESNGHPTVKPTELMRYLVRLVTQPGGTVLDPFTGSGSTGKAAVLEGFEFIGIEREAEYVAIAEARIVEAQRSLGLFA
jgi:DNA modification methylase